MTADLISRKAAMDAMKNAEMAFGYGKAVAVLADLPAADTSPLGAVDATQLAAIIRQVDGSHDLGAAALADAILAALEPPTHDTLLAHAMRLPEVAALVEAAKEQVKLHRVLRPHGIAADTCDRDLRTTLAALEASHE